MKELSDCWLYGFVDTAYLRGRSAGEVAQALCEGGADLIQLRAKGVDVWDVRRMAQEIVPITRAANVGFVVNDHLDLALEVGADICHLGQEDFFDAGYTHVDQLSRPLGSLKIGLSTHAPAQAEKAVAAGADYIAIGPVYATGTKPTAKPVTLEYVTWAAQNVQTPWFSIGGINLETLAGVLAAGARRVCVVSAILAQDDIASATRAFKRRILEHNAGERLKDKV